MEEESMSFFIDNEYILIVDNHNINNLVNACIKRRGYPIIVGSIRSYFGNFNKDYVKTFGLVNKIVTIKDGVISEECVDVGMCCIRPPYLSGIREVIRERNLNLLI